MRCFSVLALFVFALVFAPIASAAILRGEIRDADSKAILPARLSISSADGTKWFFAKSADPNGSAIIYDRGRDKSIEKHTTLSAHPFVAELPSGKYLLTVERGKEYLTATREIEVGEGDKPMPVIIELKRWINMAERGWYSGDTHVHRAIAELPNVVLAEDLNIIYPMSQWVTVSHTQPEKGRVDPQPIPTGNIFADPTHAIVPLNTEYEIFSVGKKQHTLGAVLVLGHKTPLPLGIPPVKAVAEEARKQGALLDLEKHSWAWTPMIAPIMKADLYPLSNNHVWRTDFAFLKWTLENNWRDNPRIETNDAGFTEAGWLNYGWEQYYALLNCGLRMRPTAGTANGVHPVSAGFSRVYVDLGSEKFTPELWQKRLNEGRSFVTTGPMLTWEFADERKSVMRWTVRSQHPVITVEIVRNGEIGKLVEPTRSDHGIVATGTFALAEDESNWLAIRCFVRLPNGRTRFAHTAPIFIDIPGKPIRPSRDQVRYLMQRCEEEIARCKEVLTEAELAEYREAVEFYRGQLATAR